MEGCSRSSALAAGSEAVSVPESTGLLGIKTVGLIKTPALPPRLGV